MEQTTSDREEDVRRLREIGLSEEKIRLRLLDDDLWVLEPEMRVTDSLENTEGLRQWQQASAFLSALCRPVLDGELGEFANGALYQIIWDARERADEAGCRLAQRLAAAKKTEK